MDCHTSMPVESAMRLLGIPELREGQDRAIEAVLGGVDTLAVMPTGGGKSAIYQIPALCISGVTIVFSPLISLMYDQVEALREKGIPAVALNSSMSLKRQQFFEGEVKAGRVKLIYCAPERLRRPDFIGLIQALPINALAVDEAHCIAAWEKDFRPDYAKIGQVRQQIRPRATVAVTATAHLLTIKEIQRSLMIEFGEAVVMAPDRPNLTYKTQRGNAWDIVMQFLRGVGNDRGLIYANTVKEVENLAGEIEHQLRIPTGVYHGRMTGSKKDQMQQAFADRKLQVMVATNAFGMGVNYPDLRFVLHVGVPCSLDDYAQEVGRAGRDGKPSTGLLCVPVDFRDTPEWLIKSKNPTPAQVKAVFSYYVAHPDPIIRDTAKEVACGLFGHESMESFVQSARAVLRRYGMIRSWEEQVVKPRVITINIPDPCAGHIPGTPRRQAAIRETIKWVMDWGQKDENGRIAIKVEDVAANVGKSPETVNDYLKTLKDAGYISYYTERRKTCTKVESRDFKIDEEELREKREQDFQRFAAMVQYTELKTSEDCHRYIRDYFAGEEAKAHQLVKRTHVSLW